MEALMPPSTVGRGTCAAVAGIPTGERPATYIVMIPPGTTSMGTGGAKDPVANTSPLCANAAPVNAPQSDKSEIDVAVMNRPTFRTRLIGRFLCYVNRLLGAMRGAPVLHDANAKSKQ